MFLCLQIICVLVKLHIYIIYLYKDMITLTKRKSSYERFWREIKDTIARLVRDFFVAFFYSARFFVGRNICA